MKKNQVNKHIFQEAFDLMNSERNSVFLDELEHKIGEAVLKTKGIEQASLYSAVVLNDSEKQRFELILHLLFKREIKVYYFTDSGLLGGFKLHLGDWKLDGTLIYQLERMKNALGGN
jgi:F0F1-type ATP synthase delta subunit